MRLRVNLFFEPDDAGVVACGRAARTLKCADIKIGGVPMGHLQVVCAMIPQRNCYAEMPMSRARMASASEVADFREVPRCPIPPSFCYFSAKSRVIV